MVTFIKAWIIHFIMSRLRAENPPLLHQVDLGMFLNAKSHMFKGGALVFELEGEKFSFGYGLAHFYLLGRRGYLDFPTDPAEFPDDVKTLIENDILLEDRGRIRAGSRFLAVRLLGYQPSFSYPLAPMGENEFDEETEMDEHGYVAVSKGGVLPPKQGHFLKDGIPLKEIQATQPPRGTEGKKGIVSYGA